MENIKEGIDAGLHKISINEIAFLCLFIIFLLLLLIIIIIISSPCVRRLLTQATMPYATTSYRIPYNFFIIICILDSQNLRIIHINLCITSKELY